MPVLFLGLISSAFFSSCNSEDPKRMIKVDSLGVELDKTSKEFEQVDFQKMEELALGITDELGYFQENNKDTLDLQTTIALGDYKKLKKSITKFATQYKITREKIKLRKKQLDDLKHDVTHNALADSTFNVGWRSEAKAIADIVLSVNNLNQWVERDVKKYESFHPKVVEIIDALKAKLAEESPSDQ